MIKKDIVMTIVTRRYIKFNEIMTTEISVMLQAIISCKYYFSLQI